jgi:hypothetical protein
MLAKQRYYDNTFLTAKDGSTVLFIVDAALIEFPSGHRKVRTKRDVLEFPTEAALLGAVVSGGWQEAPIEDNRSWSPSASMLETPNEA